jgi:putative sigma-54 modulation protein
MNIPTEIMFHQLDHSDAVEVAVHRWVARLEQLFDRITGCTVTISQPSKRHRHAEFSVNIVLDIPGGEITTSNMLHEDVYVAIADAFRVTRRQLAEHVAMHRGFVKTHLIGRAGMVGHNMAKHRAL